MALTNSLRFISDFTSRLLFGPDKIGTGISQKF
jgi:hypothetical protein